MIKAQKTNSDGTVSLEIECPFCGGISHLTVKAQDLEKYEGGAMIQDAFPALPPDDRELIKTGICPTCWDTAFTER